VPATPSARPARRSARVVQTYGLRTVVTERVSDALNSVRNLPFALADRCSDVVRSEAHRLLDLLSEIGQYLPGRESAMEHLELNVLILHEGRIYTAVALDVDLAAHGSSVTAAEKALGKALADRIALDKHVGEPPLKALEKAPSSYWKTFESPDAQDLNPFDLDVPPAYAIAARASRVRLFESRGV